ncbi:MAG TPA: NUDIX hydrolase, partial [Candidatus Thermoplasmatota archaeon]|nr:NUDIX hydrolase [Candidatus Thermoplasmatota archaeon]
LKGREVLLIRRGREPFKGRWALPGGFVDVGETVEEAVRRELVEETGLRGDIVDLLGVYSDPRRDPRGHTVSVTFVLKVGGIVPVDDLDDADEARWFGLDKLPDLAFDHARIVEDAKAWLALPGNLERLGDTDFGRCA